MTKLCDINPAAKDKLPSNFSDKSGVGVHYTDAFIKPMNTTLPDGTRVACKRKGLKLLLRAGADPTLKTASGRDVASMARKARADEVAGVVSLWILQGCSVRKPC